MQTTPTFDAIVEIVRAKREATANAEKFRLKAAEATTVPGMRTQLSNVEYYKGRAEGLTEALRLLEKAGEPVAAAAYLA